MIVFKYVVRQNKLIRTKSVFFSIQQLVNNFCAIIQYRVRYNSKYTKFENIYLSMSIDIALKFDVWPSIKKLLSLRNLIIYLQLHANLCTLVNKIVLLGIHN